MNTTDDTLFSFDDLDDGGDAPRPSASVPATDVPAASVPAAGAPALSVPDPADWSRVLAVFDLETTGIDVTTSRVVTAFVGVIDGDGEVVEARSWLADPGVEIPEQATAVHGVDTARARAEGRPAAEVVGEIVAELRSLLARGIPVVVYNAPYDFSLLRHEAVRHGIDPLVDPSPVVDPLVLDKGVDKYRRGKRTLEVTAAHYGVELSAAHDAGADAVASGRVAQAIARIHRAALPAAITDVHAQQIDWCAEQAAGFQDYMRRTKDPEFTTSGAWPVR